MVSLNSGPSPKDVRGRLKKNICHEWFQSCQDKENEWPFVFPSSPAFQEGCRRKGSTGYPSLKSGFIKGIYASCTETCEDASRLQRAGQRLIKCVREELHSQTAAKGQLIEVMRWLILGKVGCMHKHTERELHRRFKKHRNELFSPCLYKLFLRKQLEVFICKKTKDQIHVC